MQKLIIRLLFILAGMAFANVYGQNITFNHLTTDNGLSQFSVNSLYIDESGILWIGTREGLNRYNGEDIKTYKLQKNDPNSLFCNTVLRIVGNRNGSIYLLCTDGVAEFNLITQKFTTLLQGSINSIYYNNGLFIGKKNEVYQYNEETANFDLYYQLPNGSLDIFCMHIDKGYLWIGTTTNGVYRLNIDKKELEHPIRKGNIISFYRDSGGELWIGSWEEGLFHVKTNGKIENFKYDAKNPHSLHPYVSPVDNQKTYENDVVIGLVKGAYNCLYVGSLKGGVKELNLTSNKLHDLLSEDENGESVFCRELLVASDNELWIGAESGLYIYNLRMGKYVHLRSSINDPYSLSDNAIYSLCKDREGGIWIGSYFGGVNYYPRFYTYFEKYYPKGTDNGLHGKRVREFCQDNQGILWIGTEDGGLNRFNPKTKTFSFFTPSSAFTNVHEIGRAHV